MRETIVLSSALAFYCLFSMGLMVFVIEPSRNTGTRVYATTLGGFTITTTIPLFQNKKKFKQRKRRPKNRKRKCGI